MLPTTRYPVQPSRLYYFQDGDAIITCRDRSYRVHSALLARYSCVMRKALSMGRLDRLRRTPSQESEKKMSKRNGGVEKRRVGGGAMAKEIRYLITLDDDVQSVDLLLWCIYECGAKPRITLESLESLLHISTEYTIPSLLPLCITYAKSLALFHPLQAIPIIRRLIHHRKTTHTIAELLQSLYSEALCTILNDLPRYQEDEREEYTRILPDELRAAFSDTWAHYVERTSRLHSREEDLFAGLTYTHSSQCTSKRDCEVETRGQLRSSWRQLWESCKRVVPRPCEISRFFMTAARGGSGEKDSTCKAQICQALGWILRGLEGDEALWDWRFLSVEETSLRMAKELAIRSRGDVICDS